MGWASGSDLFSSVISSAKKAITNNKKRKIFYEEMLKAFESHDWDTQTECLGEDEVFDEVLTKKYPEIFEG